MRVPPRAGPSTVLWIAMMALRPASLLWQYTTSSWPEVEMRSKIMEGSGSGGSARPARGAGMRLYANYDPQVIEKAFTQTFPTGSDRVRGVLDTVAYDL